MSRDLPGVEEDNIVRQVKSIQECPRDHENVPSTNDGKQASKQLRFRVSVQPKQVERKKAFTCCRFLESFVAIIACCTAVPFLCCCSPCILCIHGRKKDTMSKGTFRNLVGFMIGFGIVGIFVAWFSILGSASTLAAGIVGYQRANGTGLVCNTSCKGDSRRRLSRFRRLTQLGIFLSAVSFFIVTKLAMMNNWWACYECDEYDAAGNLNGTLTWWQVNNGAPPQNDACLAVSGQVDYRHCFVQGGTRPAKEEHLIKIMGITSMCWAFILILVNLLGCYKASILDNVLAEYEKNTTEAQV